MSAMRAMPDKAFDLAVVDPPYGDGLPRQKRAARDPAALRSQLKTLRPTTLRAGGHFKKYDPDSKIAKWDIAPDQEYFDELFRVSKNQIIWGGNYFELPRTRCFLVWRKTNIPTEGFSMAAAEYAWTSFNRNAMVFEFSAINQAGRFHPTQKPPELYAWIYKHFTKKGDKILDTHLGSGSSRIAAYDVGLDFSGYEIDKEYFDKQEERFARHTAQMSLFS
jgi:site-specific DNA-methyltransferase (adenine-specific)